MDLKIAIGTLTAVLSAAFLLGMCVYVIADGIPRRARSTRRAWGKAFQRVLGHPFRALSECGFGWFQILIALVLPAVPALVLVYIAQPDR